MSVAITSMSCRYTHFDPDPESTHNLVLGLVNPGARVLEVGCATGYMSAELATRLGCDVTGVEASDSAAEAARLHCRRVVVGDIEGLDLAAALGDGRFDAILFADVLEHLRDPGAVLARIRPYLADGGAVVASIPNVAHGSVRVALLRGEWRYRPIGLLDESHLRFFTRDGVQDLFEGAGYHVTHWRRRRRAIEETEIGARVPPEVAPQLAADPEATTYQFVVRAAPSDAAAAVVELREQVAGLEYQVLTLRTDLGEACRVLGELTGVRDALTRADEGAAALRAQADETAGQLAAMGERQRELRALLLDAHEQLLERDGTLLEARARVRALENEIAYMKATSIWRLAERYWRLRAGRRRGGEGDR